MKTDSLKRPIEPGFRRRGALVASVAALVLVGFAGGASAQLPVPRADMRVPRSIPLDEALLETVRIEGQIQSWTLRKLCIDGQAYWIGFSETTPTGISPAYRDGKAEQCTRRAK
jgi:hypothetical protein